MRAGKIRLVAGLLGVVACTQPCFAWPPTFGAEFNFSNAVLMEGSPDTAGDPRAVAAQRRMRSVVERICARGRQCSITDVTDAHGMHSYRVTYRDGWWFQISTDPRVVEIQTKAATRDELYAMRERLQRHIFDAANEAGLRPATEFWERSSATGHIHNGVQSTYGDDAMLFRNDFVDEINHGEFATGTFSYDTTNAPALASADEATHVRTDQVIRQFDHAAARGQPQTIQTLAGRINDEIYSDPSKPSARGIKHQAYNVARIGAGSFAPEEQTVEIRRLRAQTSADDFLRMIDLRHGRLDFLRRQPGPIPLELRNPRELSNVERAFRFRQFVEDAGLPVARYEDVLHADELRYLHPATPAECVQFQMWFLLAR